jgi:hypothetical protein
MLLVRLINLGLNGWEHESLVPAELRDCSGLCIVDAGCKQSPSFCVTELLDAVLITARNKD